MTRVDIAPFGSRINHYNSRRSRGYRDARSKDPFRFHYYRRGLKAHKVPESVEGEVLKENAASGWQWVLNKKIQVFIDQGLDVMVSVLATSEIQKTLKTLWLDSIKVINMGADPHINKAIESELAGKGRRLLHEAVQSVFKNSYYSRYANVFLTARSFRADDPIFGGVRGWGNFYAGTGIARIIEGEGINPIIKHETIHLLGLNREDEHGGGFSKAEDDRDTECIFSSRYRILGKAQGLCSLHTSAIISFWEGLEDKTGMEFFRNPRLLD